MKKKPPATETVVSPEIASPEILPKNDNSKEDHSKAAFSKEDFSEKDFSNKDLLKKDSSNEISAAVVPQSSSWVYRPWLDLIVGCGAWSIPLLLMAYFLMNRQPIAMAVSFYGLALVFNYPHFMATIYRAYRSHEDFSEYKFFTVHVTAIVLLTMLAAHGSQRLVPWIFTLYIIWSPWHYSGQNFGIFMMFARRNGRQFTRDQRWALFSSFICSYLMLIVSFEAGASTDPFLLSLNLPPRFITAAEVVLLIWFFGLASFALIGAFAKEGRRGMLPSCVVLSTQFVWFVLPAILQLLFGWRAPQAAYAGGVLAIMHSAQYLWVTTYYAQREAAEHQDATWQSWKYFTILVAGGIALFIPGPWLVSYLFHYDLTVTFIIFAALVNIHHFILDGAIWKLRDSRIARLLLNTTPKSSSVSEERQAGFWSWIRGNAPSAHRLRVASLIFLVALGIVDISRFALSANVNSLARLKLAALLNPNDSSTERKLGLAYVHAGQTTEAKNVAQRLAVIHPHFSVPEGPGQETPAHRYQEALAKYQQLLREGASDSSAAGKYQAAIINSQARGDAREQGLAWLNFAEYLEVRIDVPAQIRFACLLKAEQLLPHADPQAQHALHMREPLELSLGAEAANATRQQLDDVAGSALSIR